VAKFDYSRSKDTAERLINRFGESYTFSRELGEAYDPATGTVSSTTETYSSDVVWLDFRKDEIDDTTILQGDVRLLVTGDVEVDDRITRDGKEWRIVNNRPLNPGGTLIYTEAQARN